MRRILGGVVVALVFAGSARAGLVESYTASVTACNQSGTPCVSENSSSPNLSVISSDGSGSAFSRGNDTVDYGSLSVSVEAGGCCTDNDFGSINLTVSFSDSVTISGGSGTGNLSYTLKNKFASLGGRGPETSTDEATFSSDVPTTFTFGQPFTIGLSVTVLGGGFLGGSGGAAVNDYSFASISVSDASGNPVTGYTYADDSYTAYPFVSGSQDPPIPPAPEPASILLGALGLIVLCGRRVCRKRWVPGILGTRTFGQTFDPNGPIAASSFRSYLHHSWA